MKELIYPELSYQIRGALFEVYNALGPGFREETYKSAVCAELVHRGISVARDCDVDVINRGNVIDR